MRAAAMARSVSLCLAAGVVAVMLLCSPAAGASGSAARGLTTAEHTALAHAGAFGRHPIRVLLLGDSIALTLGLGLAVDSKPAYGVTISNHSTLGCDLDPTLAIYTSGAIGPATPGCREWKALWPFLTAYVHPEVVALGIGRWEVSNHYYDGQWVHVGDDIWDDHVESDLRQAISIFTTFGAKVVLFTMPFIDPNQRQASGLPYSENDESRARQFNQLVYAVARQDPKHVTVINLNRMLAPHGIYTSTVDGVVARWSDGVHVTIAGGRLLAPEIMPVLDRLGLEAEKSGQFK
jgi:hypothetical protein